MKKLNLVLIVDDDEISNYVTTVTIQHFHEYAEIKTALNGVEAMNFFLQNPENVPEIIFLDINMPLMNGFEFLDWYESSVFNGTTKICMLTTSVSRDDKEKAGEYADVIDYIEKPLKYESINELLVKL